MISFPVSFRSFLKTIYKGCTPSCRKGQLRETLSLAHLNAVSRVKYLFVDQRN
jgi:hypothetical protein